MSEEKLKIVIATEEADLTVLKRLIEKKKNGR
jgi:hypothetical protein